MCMQFGMIKTLNMVVKKISLDNDKIFLILKFNYKCKALMREKNKKSPFIKDLRMKKRAAY